MHDDNLEEVCSSCAATTVVNISVLYCSCDCTRRDIIANKTRAIVNVRINFVFFRGGRDRWGDYFLSFERTDDGSQKEHIALSFFTTIVFVVGSLSISYRCSSRCRFENVNNPALHNPLLFEIENKAI